MKKYLILIPIYNDRESLTKLIENINLEVKDLDSEISIIVVNDASSQQIIDNYKHTENINSIEIINMKEDDKWRQMMYGKDGELFYESEVTNYD